MYQTAMATFIALAALTASDATPTVSSKVLAHFQDGQFTEIAALFDDKMKAALPAAELAKVWAALPAQFGAFVRAGPMRTEGPAQLTRLEFEKGALEMRVALDPAEHIRGLFFAPAAKDGAVKPQWARPAYADPARFSSFERKAGIEPKLSAELTMPRDTAQKVPAVLLVHGSGPQDLDESIGPNKIFKDLAQGLASNGIAVLRYNKRTFERSAELAALGSKITVKEEVIDDAVAALEQLRAEAHVDAARVYVIGHSLGAELVPRIIERAAWVKGGVAMAPRGRPFGDVVLSQVTALKRPAEEIEQAKTFKRTIEAASLSATTEVEIFGTKTFGAYWLSVRSPPAEAAKKIKGRLLILQGERDYQVTMADFAIWQQTLAKRPDTAFISFPSLNHEFIEGEGSSTAAEYDRPGHLSPSVIKALASYL